MQTTDPSWNAALSVGAAAWPLVAGLSIVMWSKARALKAQAVRVRVRTR